MQKDEMVHATVDPAANDGAVTPSLVERLRAMLSPNGTPACVAEAINLIEHQSKVLDDARAERQRLVEQMARCDVLLDSVGTPHDHHGEDRPLSLDERVEGLVGELKDLQDGDGTVSLTAYTAAVRGRQEFRKLFREAREEIERLRSQGGAPVPEGFVLVPDANNMTDEQAEAIAREASCCGGIAHSIYDAAIRAAPQPPEGGTGWPVLPCRFSARGCQDHAVGIFHVPQGCHCWPDPIQALCAQHACKADSPGPIECVIDFSMPSPPGQGDRANAAPETDGSLNQSALPRKDVEGAANSWVIRKNGYFYRPDRCGYTQEISAAGIYTEAEAKAEARVEPGCITAHLASEFGWPGPDTSALLSAERSRVIEIAKPIMELSDNCVNALTHQRQVDHDGCEVGISRQAVDEIHDALVRFRAAIRDLGKQTGGADAT